MLKFTIATVTYNAGKTIGRTLSSVASQTYPAVEHLIIDGCSTDETMAEIHRYVETNTDLRHPHQIVLTREPDNGLYDAMNKAITQAKGDYIIFLNAGDKFHSDTQLADIAAQLKRYNDSRLPAVIYGETDLVDDAGQFVRHRRLRAPQRLVSKSFLHGMLVCHQSFYVRTDLARVNLYNLSYRYSADYDWCIRLLCLAEQRNLTIHNTNLVLTDYLAEGLTTRNRYRSLKERLRLMAVHYGWWRALLMHAWFVVRAVVMR